MSKEKIQLNIMKKYRVRKAKMHDDSSGQQTDYGADDGDTQNLYLFEGVPGKECGINSMKASSYFNRMFQTGISSHASQYDRYTICLIKK